MVEIQGDLTNFTEIIKQPMIKIEEDGFGIYIKIPKQIINSYIVDYLEWQFIFDDDYENSKLIKSDFFNVDNKYQTDEILFLIKPQKKYLINLYLNGNRIGKWEFFGISQNKLFMCFDQKRELVVSDVIPKEKIILILSDEYFLDKSNLISMELDRLVNWEKYKMYSIDLKDAKNLNINKFGMYKTIAIEKEKSEIEEGRRYELTDSEKPFIWQWNNRCDIKLNWDCEVKNISINEIENIKNLLCMINREDLFSIIISMKIFDQSDMMCSRVKYKLFRDKLYNVPLNNILNAIKNRNSNEYKILITIYDNKGLKLDEVNILNIKEDISASEYVLRNEDGDLVVEWNEVSNKKSRELAIYNLFLPFENPIVFKLNDGETTYKISEYREVFSNSLYGVVVRNQGTIQNKYDILSLGKFKRFNIKNGKEARFDEQNDFFYSLFKMIISKEGMDYCKVEKFNFKIDRELIYKLTYFYLYIHKNLSKENKKEVNNIFRILMEKIEIEDYFMVIKELINFNLDENFMELLAFKWNILNINRVNKNMLSLHERKYIWSNIPLLAMIIDLRSIPGDSEDSSKRILSEFQNYKEYVTSHGIGLNLWENNDLIDIKIDQRIIGTIEDINRYFEYSFATTKKSSTKSKEKDKYEEYKEDTGIKVLGNTYLKSYLDWNKKNGHEKSLLIESKSNEIVSKYKLLLEIQENLSIFDDKILELINKRIDTSKMRFYYSSLVMYVSSVCAHKNIKNKNFERLTNYFYQTMGEVAIRDLIIFEVYNRINIG